MSAAPSVEVVIPSWRRPEALRRCLAGLQRQAVGPSQVVVARRWDDVATRAVVADASSLRLREVTVAERGVVAARNAALAVVGADVVAFVDDDAVPRPDWIQRMLRHYADPAVGAVGGRDFVYHGDRLQAGEERVVGRVLGYGRFVGFHHLGAGAVRAVELLKGANMSVRTAALDGRGFDAELRGEGAEHHEDWGLTLRLRRDGWRVLYDPKLNVDHYEAARVDGDPRLEPTGRALTDRLHNQTYIAVRYLPWPKAAAHVGFAVAVGTTAGPGLLQALLRLGRGEEPSTTALALRSSLAGRAAGVATGLTGRRADRRERSAKDPR